ncbi:MAG: hypothetical protein ACW99Q_21835 [Candidatus Kariarchaeaceae archaeon]|jgi:hypothetical protein
MSAIFQIEAISRSNAKLTRFKIPVPQFIIGHSFDTIFKITNLTSTKSARLAFNVEAKMGEYTYEYKRDVEEVPAGASLITKPITWNVLNQGICTFSFLDIIVGGETSLIKELETFVDINGKPIEPFKIFHSVVTTSPEGVYEYWAMILSAIGLFIVAIEKLVPLLRFLVKLI